MIRGKTRHQLFLPDDVSRRLSVMAKAQKRARSDLLVEMVDAWMNRRAAADAEEGSAKALRKLQRALDETRRETFIISYALFVFVRHYLQYAAMNPSPNEAAQAAGKRIYDQFLDRVAARLAKGPETMVAATAGPEEQGS